MRKTLGVIAALAIAMPLAAQQQAGAAAHDPTNAIKGSGRLPDGWTARFDPPRPTAAIPKLEDVNVVTMGSGLHFTSGPAAIYYNAKDMGTGEYAVTATFSQRKSVGHEAYGIFIGGRDLQGETQRYTYFLVRQDGKVLIKQRLATETPTLLPWTETTAVRVPGSGRGGNTLAVRVAGDAAVFLVNDTEVARIPRAQLETEGVVGYRVNHNLRVQLGPLRVTQP
jgi:hypothetical protein